MVKIHQYYYSFPTFDGLLIYERTFSHNLGSSEYLDKIVGRLSLHRDITLSLFVPFLQKLLINL